jgi:hypothetical protein
MANRSADDDSCFVVSAHVDKQSGGGIAAYVNVYSTANDAQSATDIATRELKEEGWRMLEPPSVAVARRADYGPHGLDGIEYFEQALVDGIVLVFHEYPSGKRN